MKLRISAWRLIWRFLLAMLVIYTMAFLVLMGIFFEINFEPFYMKPNPWGAAQTVLTVLLGVLGIAAFLPSLFTYYQIEKKSFIMWKYFKVYEFEFANIEFVDFDESRRKGMVVFYSKKAKMRYLLSDKNGELLKAIEHNCKNLLTVEEFRKKHPEEKY